MKLEQLPEHELIGQSFPLLWREQTHSMENGYRVFLSEGLQIEVVNVVRSEEWSLYQDWAICKVGKQGYYRIPTEELKNHYSGQAEVKAWREIYDEIIAE